ncbi:MAG: deoxyribose-phosphate aldolase [Clostridiales bacterium]|nr:deoxyribose-phosphate aldolase [Clostridiales bacterium]
MENIEKYVDHTLLKADAKKEAIIKICMEAAEHGFKSVCVNSCHCALVSAALKGTGVKTCCVVGFPLGAMATEAKAFEAAYCVANGADEVDMVINIGAVKDGDIKLLEDDIRAVVKAAHNEPGPRHALLKVIIETCLLTDEEKILACEAAMRAGADYVKTSTGFSTGGATPEDVALMRGVVGTRLGVKASGGVRTPEDAEKMIAAGASRLGTSNGVKLLG